MNIILKVMPKEIENEIYNSEFKKHYFKDVLMTYIIPFSIIRKFKNELNNYHWSLISSYQPLTSDIIEEFSDNLSLYDLSLNKNISIDTYISINSKDMTKYLGLKSDVREDLIELYKEEINWFDLLKNNQLSEEFLIKHLDYINWTSLCSYYKLSEGFIRANSKLLDWELATIHQSIPEDLIEANIHRINGRIWLNISKYQRLSELFIETYSDFVDWNLITKYQKLSFDFIFKNKDKIKWVNIHLNPYVDKTYIDIINPNNNKDKEKELLLNKISRPYTETDKKKEDLLNKIKIKDLD